MGIIEGLDWRGLKLIRGRVRVIGGRIRGCFSCTGYSCYYI